MNIPTDCTALEAAEQREEELYEACSPIETKLLIAATRELEKLRAEMEVITKHNHFLGTALETAERDYTEACKDAMAEAHKRREAEQKAERYREALEKVRDMDYPLDCHWYDHCSCSYSASNFAEQALKEEEKNG
jgi:hypothetical protein